MSTLTLNVVATGLQDIEKLNAGFAQLTANLVTFNAALGNDDEALRRIRANALAFGETLKGLNQVLAKTGLQVDEETKEINALGMTLIQYSKAVKQGAETEELLTASLKKQVATLKAGTAAVTELDAAKRAEFATAKSLQSVQGLLSKEFQAQINLRALLNKEGREALLILQEETVAQAKRALQQKLITEQQYTKIVAARPGTEAALDARIVQANLDKAARVAASEKETAAAVQTKTAAREKAAAATVAALEAEKAAIMSSVSAYALYTQAHGDATLVLGKFKNEALAASAAINALTKEQREEYVAVLSAQEINSLYNVELQKQAKLKAALAGAADANLVAIRAETAALEQQAVALGVIPSKIKPIIEKKRELSSAASDLRGALRGAAGAMDMLWLTYAKSLGPMIAAFGTFKVIVDGVKASMDFSYSTKYLNELAKATGDYSMSLSGVRRGLLDIKETTHTVAELSEATKEMVKQGFSQSDALKSVATLSKMAYVAQEDLGNMTTYVMSQFRAWNVESVGAARGVSSVSEVANAMTFVAQKTALDIKELGKQFKYTSELAGTSNLTFYEMIAALGLLSNIGVRNTGAATSLRSAMANLANMSASTVKRLHDLRIEFSAFTAAGQKKDMLVVIQELITQIDKLSDKNRAEALSAIFNVRGMRFAANAVRDLSGEWAKLTAEAKKAGLEGEFLNTVFAGVTDELKTQILLLKADYKRALTEAFESKGFSNLVKSMRESIDSGTFKSVIDGISGVTGAVVGLLNLFNSLPAGIVGSTGVGLVGTMLFGPATGVFLAMASQAMALGTDLAKDMAAKQVGIANWFETFMVSSNKLEKYREQVLAGNVKALTATHKSLSAGYTNPNELAELSVLDKAIGLAQKRADILKIIETKPPPKKDGENKNDNVFPRIEDFRQRIELYNSQLRAHEKFSDAWMEIAEKRELADLSMKKLSGNKLLDVEREMFNWREKTALDSAVSYFSGESKLYVQHSDKRIAAELDKYRAELELQERSSDSKIDIAKLMSEKEATLRKGQTEHLLSRDIAGYGKELKAHKTYSDAWIEADLNKYETELELQRSKGDESINVAALVAERKRLNHDKTNEISLQSEIRTHKSSLAYLGEYTQEALKKRLALFKAESALRRLKSPDDYDQAEEGRMEAGIITANEIAVSEKRLQNTLAVYKAKGSYSRDYFALEASLLDESYAKEVQKYGYSLEAYAAHLQRKEDLNDQMLLKNGSFFDGMLVQAKKHSKEVTTIGELGAKAFTDIYQTSIKSASNVLYDTVKQTYKKHNETVEQTFTSELKLAKDKYTEEKTLLDKNLADEKKALQEKIDSGEASLEDMLKLETKYKDDLQALSIKHNAEVAELDKKKNSELKNQWSDLSDIWKGTLDNMLRSFTDWLAQMALQWVASEVISWLSDGKVGVSFGGSAGGGKGGGISLNNVSTGVSTASTLWTGGQAISAGATGTETLAMMFPKIAAMFGEEALVAAAKYKILVAQADKAWATAEALAAEALATEGGVVAGEVVATEVIGGTAAETGASALATTFSAWMPMIGAAVYMISEATKAAPPSVTWGDKFSGARGLDPNLTYTPDTGGDAYAQNVARPFLSGMDKARALIVRDAMLTADKLGVAWDAEGFADATSAFDKGRMPSDLLRARWTRAPASPDNVTLVEDEAKWAKEMGYTAADPTGETNAGLWWDKGGYARMLENFNEKLEQEVLDSLSQDFDTKTISQGITDALVSSSGQGIMDAVQSLDATLGPLPEALWGIVPPALGATQAAYDAATGILTLGNAEGDLLAYTVAAKEGTVELVSAISGQAEASDRLRGGIEALSSQGDLTSESLSALLTNLGLQKDGNDALALAGVAAVTEMQAIYGDGGAFGLLGDATSWLTNHLLGKAAEIAAAADEVGSFTQALVSGGANVAHADGGIFTRPTLLGRHLVAEAGRPEAILPLPEGPRTMDRIIERLDRIERGGNRPVNVTVNVAGKEFYADVAQIADAVRVEATRRNAGMRAVA